jgi:hypothetical protein
MGSTPGDQVGIVLPLEAQTALDQAVQEAAPAPPPQGNAVLPTVLGGGVVAFPVDASTYLHFGFWVSPLTPPLVLPVTVECGAKILQPDDTVVPCLFTYTINSTGWTEFFSDLPPGYLLSVTMTNSQGQPRPGMMLASISLVHNEAPGPASDILLFQGYLSSTRSLGWPPGVLEPPDAGSGYNVVVYPPAPAPGSGLFWQCPSVRADLLDIGFLLTTGVGAGNRTPFIFLTDASGNCLWLVYAATTQAASSSLTWDFPPGLHSPIPNPAGGTFCQCPPDLSLRMSDYLSVGANGMWVTDTITNVRLALRVWM